MNIKMTKNQQEALEKLLVPYLNDSSGVWPADAFNGNTLTSLRKKGWARKTYHVYYFHGAAAITDEGCTALKAMKED